MEYKTRLGVDIGGTFTDVVLEHKGALYSSKVLTTYDIPEDAILDGIEKVCTKSNIMPQEIEQIIHGTTLLKIGTGPTRSITGYRNIVGAPQAFATWGTNRALYLYLPWAAKSVGP